jgi:hypothetical protein
MDLTGQIIGAESGGDPNARNPNSSAAGPGQFIDSTWLGMIRKYHPELAQLPQQEILGLKSDANLSREMTDKYAQENQAFLQSKGLPVTPGTTYLGHFLGPQGAAKVLSASPDTPAGGILGDSVVAANPFLGRMSAGDLRQWAEGKMQATPLPPAINVGSAPSIGAPAAPSAADLPAAPTQTQQFQGAGGNGGGGTPAQQQPITQAMLQHLAMYRPQVNQAPLQNFMQQLPTTLFPSNLKPFSF